MTGACCRIDFQIRACLPATLAAAEEFFAEFRNRLECTRQRSTRFEVELLVREALTNAVVHGSNCNAEMLVWCVVRMTGRRLLISVRDQGTGFDWRKAANNQADLTACSGRGMEILRRYATRVRFNRAGNSVAILKRF